MSRRNDRKFSFTKYPGDQWRHFICDLCGCKRFIKDGVYINQQYNRLNGALVCRWHADPVHPQDIPHWVKERPVSNPQYIRPRPSYNYVVNEASDIVPGAPQILSVTLDSLTDMIRLNWFGPSNTGSSAITGYQINIANPQENDYSILVTNTNEPNTTYLDTIDSPTGFYSYTVQAVNSAGVGPISNEAFYPYQVIPVTDILITTDSDIAITTDSGNDLIKG
ncbi:Fibronectin type III [uncultured Caudovirales phage]|uniref:Fibronectin type III n=1 Tax=uncultured Caudovirales phage TaxID=2100421 RepID=A0A6J5KJC8_9CAUD|nr:Fibronectin type III [uncultured Caudovirales phage]